MRLSPRTILCVGRNYLEHAKELGNVVNTSAEPFFFLKPPSSLIQYPEPIRLPPGAEVHHEVELGILIGSRARRLRSDKEAKECVAGYFVAIDLTARNWQSDAKQKGLPWTKAKGCDTFLPCGEVVKKSELQDPNNVTLTLQVNGVTKQHDSTSLMIHNVWKLLQYASAYHTLEAGDVLLTGTPKGVSAIKVGDKVAISGVGRPVTFNVESWA